jgi:hypothetical protein
MLTRDVVDKLNELISRELTALEWHDRALEKVVHAELAHLLTEFREQHDQRITVLRNTICELIEEEVLCAMGRSIRGTQPAPAPAVAEAREGGRGARRRSAGSSRRAITRRTPVVAGARRP